MSKNRAGTFGNMVRDGWIPGRSKRAVKQKLFLSYGKPCIKCGEIKQFETLWQVKCTKCKHIKNAEPTAYKKINKQ